MGNEDASSLEGHQSGQNDSRDSFQLPKETPCPVFINEKALMRKIDLRVIPVLFIVYFAAFLDRVNISNALTLGLPKDLHLKGMQPNIALTIFFVPYVVFEIPSNFLMKRCKPHVWLSGCILCFGIVMMCQGWVQNYSGLLATRFLLGLAEAGIFPGSFYLISFWYKREEAQQRFTYYWCSVLAASMFGGLLASAISNMDGIQGYSSWRWIFILEGIATILIGIASYFFISDFPSESKWLNEDERAFVISRSGSNEAQGMRITYRDILFYFADPKNICGALLYFAMVVPIYAYAYFAPTIIKALGYSTVQTQLHTVPPVAAALALCLIFAYFSDRFRLRSPFIAVGIALCITGVGILLTVHGRNHFSVEYLGICFVAMGAFATGPIVVCWYVMNLVGHTQRSIGTAFMISFGNTGGFVATFCFLSRDAPNYHTGYSVVMGCVCLGAASAAMYALLIMWERRKMVMSGEKGSRQWLYL
ncbi:High-affinity nicotinic acid transporter [Lecanora helva]